MTVQPFAAFTFDDVHVRPQTSEVFKSGVPLQLEPKAFKLLIFLVENRHRLIEKNEILDIVWEKTAVSENALASAVAKLRKTLGDDSRTVKYIQTVHTRGYRFIAEVRAEDDSETNGHTPLRAENEVNAPASAGKSAESGDIAVATDHSRRTSPAKTLAVAGVLSVMLIGAGLFWKQLFLVQPRASPAATSVAVLPFHVAGMQAENEYLGIEIADALASRLSRSTHLVVRPTSVVLHYAESNASLPEVGRALKVDYLLSGEIRRASNRITTQLIRIRDGTPLQTTSYDETFISIFQAEESLSSKILRAMTVTLSHEETQQFRKRFTENAEAYDAFLKGHYLMNLATAEGTNNGITSFQRAIELDPHYAMAYAGLADCYLRLFRFGGAPAEFVPKSRAAATKALEIDDTVAYAHSMLGYIAYQYDWDYARADQEYRRARKLEPALVHQWHASYLLALDRIPEADKEYRAFADFLPFMLPGRASFGQYFYLTRQYDKAVDQLLKTTEMAPGFPPAIELLGMVYEQQGRTNEAITELQRAIDLSAGTYGLGSLGHLYAGLTRRRDAQRMLDLLVQQSKREYVSPYQLALVYAGLGENDQAIAAIEKACRERSIYVPYLRFDPRINNLRTEPQVQDLVRRMGFSF